MGYIPAYPIGGTAGALPLPVDYIIYKSGSDCKALNGSTGVVDSTSSSHNVPIQYAIDSFDHGGLIHIKQGTYDLRDAILTGTKSVRITGDGWGPGVNPQVHPLTVIRPHLTLGADWLFIFGSDSANSWNCSLENLMFYGREYTDCLGAIFWKSQFHGQLKNLFISNFYNTATPARAIYLGHVGAYNTGGNAIDNVHIWDTPIGIELSSLANSNTFNHCHLQNGVQSNAKGMYFRGCDTALVLNCHMETYDEAGSIALHIETGWDHRFIGTRFEANRVNVQIDAGASRCYFTNCSLGTPDVSNVLDSGAVRSLFCNCFGYVTEKWGTSTGTGAQQTIAHGLAGTPDMVLLSDKELNAIPYQSAAADATNIYILAALNQDYTWYARRF